MELRQLTLRPRPGPLKGFFRLPIELRNRVYAYCLLESPKWEKRHDAACDYTPRDVSQTQTVTFHIPTGNLTNMDENATV